MTTIFVDKEKKTIYADTNIVKNDQRYCADKVFTGFDSKNKGFMVAYAGELTNAIKIKNYIFEHLQENSYIDEWDTPNYTFLNSPYIKELFTKKELVDTKDQSFDVIFFAENGDLFLIDESFEVGKINSNFYTGTGGSFANFVYTDMTSDQGLSWYWDNLTEEQKKIWDILFIAKLGLISRVDSNTNDTFKSYNFKEMKKAKLRDLANKIKKESK